MVKITQKLGRVINQVYDSNTLAMHIKALHPSLVTLKHFRKWVLCSNTRWQLLPFNKWCAVCIIRTLTLVWSKDPEFSWSANAFSQHTKKESDWKRPEKFQTELSKREQLSFKNTFYRFSLAKHCSSTNWRWCDGRYDDRSTLSEAPFEPADADSLDWITLRWCKEITSAFCSLWFGLIECLRAHLFPASGDAFLQTLLN